MMTIMMMVVFFTLPLTLAYCHRRRRLLVVIMTLLVMVVVVLLLLLPGESCNSLRLQFHPPRCAAHTATWIVSTALFAVTAQPHVKRHVVGVVVLAKKLVDNSLAKCAGMEAVVAVMLVYARLSHGW